MASWRAPSSILKPPGLDFGSSGVNFFEMFACLLACMPRTCQELAENLPRHTTPVSIDNLLRLGDVGRDLPRGVGRRWSPPRGFAIRRPPQVCQRRARLMSNWLCPIPAGQSRYSFEQFFRAIRPEVFFPLSFPFPSGLGITGAQRQKIAFCVLLAHLGRFFRLPNRTRKMTSKKHLKKCEN